MKLTAALLFPLLAFSQTGEIILTGTIISGAPDPPSTGFEADKAFDGNTLTSYAAGYPTGTAWVGIDATKAVRLTKVWLMPRAGTSGEVVAKDRWTSNMRIHASASADFTGSATLYTFSNWASGLNGLYPHVLLPFSVSPGADYRYYRFYDGAWYGNIAELRFQIQATADVSARPVPPVISPGSGTYPSGSVTVTITSATTSAAIRYTTNGDAPTCASTLYEGAFALAVSGSVHLQAIACDASTTTEASEVSSQKYKNYGWAAGELPLDELGRKQNAHASNVWFADGYWWRIGMNLNWTTESGGLPLASGPGWWIYRSSDFLTWEKVTTTPILTNTGWTHHERAHVLYNSSTSKYVLWANCGNGYNSLAACIATADAPAGPWTLIDNDYSPSALGYKDNNLFLDDDGQAYAVFVTGDQQDMAVVRLNSDFLTANTATLAYATQGAGREAPAMFKRGSTYFLLSSGTMPPGSPGGVAYQTASSPLGPWSGLTSLYSQDPTGTSWDGQPTQVVRFGSLYMLIADAWVLEAVSTWYEIKNSTLLHLPLVFPTSTTVRADVLTDAPANWSLAGRGLFPFPGGIQR